MSVSRDFIDCYSRSRGLTPCCPAPWLLRMRTRGIGRWSGTPDVVWRDNVGGRFPRRPRFRPIGDILPPSWLLLPYLGQEKLRAAYGGGFASSTSALVPAR